MPEWIEAAVHATPGDHQLIDLLWQDHEPVWDQVSESNSIWSQLDV